MQIVIDIPKEEYKRVMDGKWESNALADYIENGKPILEGHGRLIDLEEVRDRYVNIIKVSNSELENLRMLAEILDTSPTIVEADRSEDE